MPTRTSLLAAALLAASSLTQSQTVWRCGNSYGQQPCAGGAPVAASDTRTPADAARSANVARQDWALADRLEKDRLAQEKRAGKALVIGGVQAAASPASAARKEAKKKDPFSAVDPATVKHKKKKKASG